MPSAAVVQRIAEGAAAWNAWRKTEEGRTVDLSDTDFFSLLGAPQYFSLPEYSGFNFSNSNLNRISMRNCVFTHCSFANCSMPFSDLVDSYCLECDFSGTELNVSKIGSAKFVNCDFSGSQLSYCSAEETDFSGCTFRGSRLDNMSLVRANFTDAVIQDVIVYGTSAWDLDMTRTEQRDIYISERHPNLSIPTIELAQFIALLLNNAKVRDVIDTITSKVVLILGRFTQERKAVLDAVRTKLQARGYVPILFDFEGPQSRDLTETVLTLAGMARFVIADLTDAKSVPQELTTIVPNLPSVPVQPILAAGATEYGMFEHFRRCPWVLPAIQYNPKKLSSLVTKAIKQCEGRHAEAFQETRSK